MNRKVKIFTFILLLMATLVAMIGCTPVQESDIHIEYTSDNVTIKSMQSCYVRLEIKVSDGNITETYHEAFSMNGKHSVKSMTIQDLTNGNKNNYFGSDAQIIEASIEKIENMHPVEWIAILFGVMLLSGLILMILGDINDNSVMYVLGEILFVIGLPGVCLSIIAAAVTTS